MTQENNEFKVPDKINNVMLSGFYKEKKANKDKRIKEILKRLKLSDSLDNLIKADKVIERRVALGLLGLNYELLDEEERAYTNNTQATQRVNNRGGNTPLNMLNNLLDSITNHQGETAESQIFFKYNNQLLSMDVTFLKNVLADYMENNSVPIILTEIAGKEELTESDELELVRFFERDKSFARFCIDKKTSGI